MFKNYLATAFNKLLKDKLFSFINIVGLAIGLAACLLIALYVQDETSYDKHWTHADRLYRINSTLDARGGNPTRLGNTSMLARGALKQFFPGEIVRASRVRASSREMLINNVRYLEPVVDVDADIVNMLDFEVLSGSLSATLADPRSIALSAATAFRYFGNDEALGQTITIVRAVNQAQTVSEDFRVTAVYRLPSKNSVLNLPALTMLNEETFNAPTFSNWVSLDFATFVQLSPKTDVQSVSALLPVFTERNVELPQLNLGPDVKVTDRASFDLQNIAGIYLDSSVQSSMASGNKTVVVAFSAIAVLILLIGCINFTVLGTAKAMQHAKEVAMRKTLGASRKQLILQFLGESFFIVLLAIVLSLVFVEIMLPVFENVVGKNLQVSYTEPTTYLSLLVLFLVVGITGGCYPAFLLSHFRPAETLKANKSVDDKGSISLRGALVVFQFSVSIALIIATAVIYAQVQYSANRDPGFSGDNILVIGNLNRRNEVSAQKLALRQEIAKLSNVSNVSLSGHQPMQTSGYVTMTLGYTLEGGSGALQSIATMSVDHEFFETYRIPFVAGRNYAEVQDQSTRLFDGSYQIREPSESNVVINASTAHILGFSSPEAALGARLVNTRGFNPALHNFTIIGVVADTQFYSLRSEPRPEIYVLSPQYMSDVISVRFTGNPQAILNNTGTVWGRVMGEAELFTAFVDQNMAQEFAQEKVEAQLLVSFSFLAILIACLGLYGSAAFTVERRTKEIGIRKVMGAEVREIVSLLLWQFSKPVLLANIIAWPVALWAMLNWLQRFPFQIDSLILIPLCVLAGAVALSIAWLTVAGNTVRVATTKPVYALRYE